MESQLIEGHLYVHSLWNSWQVSWQCYRPCDLNVTLTEMKYSYTIKGIWKHMSLHKSFSRRAFPALTGLHSLRTITNPSSRITDYRLATKSAGDTFCLAMLRLFLSYKCTFYIRNHLPHGTESSLINLTPNPSLILSSSNREPVTTGSPETDVVVPQSLLSAG